MKAAEVCLLDDEMQVVWSVKPDSAVLQFFSPPALYSKTKGAQLRRVCWQVHTQKHKPDAASNPPSPLPGHYCPADTHKSEAQAFVVQGNAWAAVPCLLWLLWVFVSGVLVGQVETPGAVVIRWPKRRWPLVVEFPANAARTWLSSLSTLGVENGTAAVTPANTKTHSFTSCSRKLSASPIHTAYQLSGCVSQHGALT